MKSLEAVAKPVLAYCQGTVSTVPQRAPICAIIVPRGDEMTKLLEKAFQEAAKLSEEEQDALARAVLEELASERRWDELFANSPHLLSELAEEALAEHRAGRTEALDPDKL